MNKKFEFLTSPRFWALVIGAVSIYFETKGWIGEPERNLIATVTGIFLGVGTFDKAVEKLAGSKTTVSVSEPIPVTKGKSKKK
jgi:hypothetical protein